MFFNGLLNKIDIIDVRQLIDQCHELFFSKNQNKYHTKIEEFNKSKWAVLELCYQSPIDFPRYFPVTNGYQKIVNRILDVIGHNHYVAISMIAWLNPGEKIEKHVDLQNIYAHTRRIHVQLLQNSDAYMSVWAGDHEYKVNIKPGTIYELNNRAYHSVTNLSNNDLYALLVIDFGIKGQTFTSVDANTRNTDIPASDKLPLWY